MPDMGLPAGPSRRSHTASQQWQSFEIKMRYRRAERCIAHAEAALIAGRHDEARRALEEAQALNSESPSFEKMLDAVRQRELAAAGQRVRRQRVAAAALVIAMVVGAGALGLWFRTSSDTRDDNAAIAATRGTSSKATGPVSAPGPASPEDTASVQVATKTTTPTVSAFPVPTSGGDPPMEPSPTPAPPPLPVAAMPPGEPELPAVVDLNPSLTLKRPTTADATESPIARITGPDGLVRSLPSAALPVVAMPPPPRPAPEAAPKPVQPPAISEETKVRAVLARFEAAYTNLSAAAAQEVWPTVDARTLASAFNSLQSQQVSLGRCSIVIDRATARANCTGTTSWTPKIGGGRRIESRRWEFDLVAEDGTWHILQAIAR
jgi:hypothetical protein